jgi:hypothetical protein
MQRLLIALMAIGSILIVNPAALRAQGDGRAVDPASGPHAIDEPAASPIASGTSSSHPSEHAQVMNSVPSANPLPDQAPPVRTGAIQMAIAGHASHGVRKQRSWCGAQFALLLLGLLGACLAVIVTPNAARKVADHVSSNARRDLRIGVFVGLGLLGVLIANAILLNIPIIKVLWAPIGIMVAFAPLLILGFGWIAAMRCAGDCVARKLNRTGEGSTFKRMALGLFAFFLANVFLGSISRGLGVIGLGFEIAVALMGLGATVVIASGSGFGRKA